MAATFGDLGAMVMFVSALLGQIDISFGLASRTTAGAVVVCLRFNSLFHHMQSI